MIISSIKNKEFTKYLDVHPRLRPAMEAALELLEKGIEDGKYEIDGDKIFLSISSYKTKEPDDAKLEIHKDYIDVQLVLKGEELIYMDSVEGLREVTPYKPDAAFYEVSKDADSVILKDGEFAVIFPYEGHAPCLAVTECADVRKMVIKILA